MAMLSVCPAAATVPCPAGHFPLVVALRSVPAHLRLHRRLLALAPAVPTLLFRTRALRHPQKKPQKKLPPPPEGGGGGALPAIEASAGHPSSPASDGGGGGGSVATRMADPRLKRQSAAGYLVPPQVT